MPATPIPPARCRRCMKRSSGRRSSSPPPEATASSTAISPVARWSRATMSPDADASKLRRADPFAPLTSELLPVGDGHEVYVERVGREDGIPALYLHGG